MDFFSYPEIKLSPNELVALESNNIYTFDLITSESHEVAKRIGLSVGKPSFLEAYANVYQRESVDRITQAVIKQTIPTENRSAHVVHEGQRFLTTGDGNLDELLGGGVPLQHITEFVGESGVGKSQFMTQFCITTQLPTSLGGLAKEVVYISTESGLATSRAREICAGFKTKYPHHETLLPLRPLDNIHVVVCPDLELQDHILYYQLPVLLKQKKGKIGSIVIDSVAANYRAEHEGRTTSNGADKRAGDMAVRTKELTRFSAHLRKLAVEFDLAVIVANQVSDRISNGRDQSVLSLDHQSQWFGGWKMSEPSPKLPALGLVWANAVHCRIALKKVRNGYGDGEIGYSIGVDGVKSV
ncbi:DNA repair and recombination protein radA5 [Taphrina deformans PYCC 5710]|uniref:DNA repair and recombination protein radA5 n=1 Tax=Taphrina deformans (strain PYCC 5710 / ATCC 11124 / CBS 356.35 / IMI 108563 / JCM 9778 / NBRC 8474) TaxID=1097556 RepID=R4XB46_TAPDE|nr:DNA repair and recombination protein radA5 [Taphrina deformans PYCC 5710]|eukprot:CCG80523.1 DNA repair and recombination protein radA5 [Taphrina deformans PYCC 5710]